MDGWCVAFPERKADMQHMMLTQEGMFIIHGMGSVPTWMAVHAQLARFKGRAHRCQVGES